jgi:hypothetical protein
LRRTKSFTALTKKRPAKCRTLDDHGSNGA